MRFKNPWTDKKTQQVKVHLKRHGWKSTPDAKGSHWQLLDLKEGEPKSVEVTVLKYGLTRNEKLGIIVRAALDHFNDDLNRYLEEFYSNAVYRGVPSDTTPAVEVSEYQLKHINETAYLDKDHKLHYAKMPAPVPSEKLGSLAAARMTKPTFLNEKPPATRSMTDLQNWVKERQTQNLTTAEAMIASTANLGK